MKNQTPDLWISWDSYHTSIERLAWEIHKSGWKFDQILCLARGGMRIGDVFSRLFNVPLAVLSTSSYREENGTLREDLELAKNITYTRLEGGFKGRLLILDDLVDSGVTLFEVKNRVLRDFPSVSEMKTAVIWYKGLSDFVPDYFLEYLPENPWIHQPFEIYDGMKITDLDEKFNQHT